MNDSWITILIFAASGLISFFLFRYLGQKNIEKSAIDAEEKAKKLISNAESEIKISKKEALLEAREEALKLKNEFKENFEKIRKEQDELSQKQKQQQEEINKKLDYLNNLQRELGAKEHALQTRDKGIELRENELEVIISSQNEKLQKIAQMTPDEAKQQLMDNMISAAKMEAAAHIKEIKEKAEQDAEKEVKEILLSAIYRCAADHTVESTVSVVNLPSDEMKGRIIGREGRNIRSFETATGIDVIVDDTPEAVILSGYDPVRREIARMALEKLISDGRIHPTRIEEVVEKSQQGDGSYCS